MHCCSAPVLDGVEGSSNPLPEMSKEMRDGSNVSSEGLVVTEQNPDAVEMWDRFISGLDGATYCHRQEWKQIVEAAYSLDARQIYVFLGSECVAVFPVVVMPKLPGQAEWAVSQAFCNYGDILIKPGNDPDALRTACLQYLARQGVHKVEVRHKDDTPGEATEVTLILALPHAAEDLWRRVGDKARNQVRKAEKKGLTAQWGREQVDELYDVYAANMGRLGTPVHARAFFVAIVREFGEDADVLTVRLAGKVVGAMLLLKHGATWADPFASSLPGYQQYNPNMLLYWEALRIACERGAKFFDFGRSKSGSGTDKFKRQWGAMPYPLDYRTYIDGVAHGAASTTLYRSSAGKMVSDMWRYLPSWAQLRLGPMVRRYIP